MIDAAAEAGAMVKFQTLTPKIMLAKSILKGLLNLSLSN